jgi:Fe-S cluster assembly ATP-binding protein
MLEVKKLHAGVEGIEILKGVDLTVKPGEVHAIMGPNGSGKSTFAQVLAGHPAYEVSSGSATFEGKDLLEMDADERARAGMFLAFQYPVAIRGVTNAYFLQSALNAIRKERGLEELDTLDFAELLEKKLEKIGWDDSLIRRVLRWREEAQRDPAALDTRAEAGNPRRDRLRAGHRCGEGGCRRGERSPQQRSGVHRGDAL